MKKIKIVATLIAAIFLSLSATSISGAVDLNADINVNVDQFIGLVSPIIDTSRDDQKNQNITFLVNVTEPPDDEKNNSYIVEDQLKININVNDQSERATFIPFILPRLIFYKVIVSRDLSYAISLPKTTGSLIKRLFPINAPFGQKNVVNTLGGSTAADNISINVYYKLTKDIYLNGENLTLNIFIMGFLPGNVNGISDEKIPIITHEVINLKVTYEDKTEV
jgi:hypothetical protein